MRKILNTALSLICSLSILQFSKHFQLIFDNLNLNKAIQIKQNIAILILLREATLESKIAPNNRNSQEFLLHTSKTFSNVELFSIFSQLVFGTNFHYQNKNNVAETISCLLFTSCQKNIAYIMCLNT